MAVIESVYARQILDSRGNPTVEVVLDTEDGAQGLGLVPSGASTGEAEAWERRDGDKAVYQGKGVLNAVKAVNEEIAPKVIGRARRHPEQGPPRRQRHPGRLAGRDLRLGRIRGHAAVPLPRRHQRPHPAGAEHEHHERWRPRRLRHRHLNTGLGDEGGFAPKMKSNEDSIKFIMDAISAAGYEPGKQIGISLDVASSEFYNKETGKYRFDGEERESAYMLDYYEKLVNEYPIVSIEDPFQEEGWEDWAAITARLGDRLQFVGDDLLVTNPKRLAKGIELGAANSLLVKLNQIGTVTETLDAIELATKNGFTSMVSHRSGETPDTTISDLAVAKNTGQIKTGAPARGERIAKYNRLLEIEEELGSTAQYAGYSAFKACKKYM